MDTEKTRQSQGGNNDTLYRYHFPVRFCHFRRFITIILKRLFSRRGAAGASPVDGEVGGVPFDAAAPRCCKIEFAGVRGGAAAFLRPEGARRGDIGSHNLHAIFA